MAIVKTINGPLRVTELPTFGNDYQFGASRITISDDAGNTYVFKGAFTYDQDGPHGTITGIEFSSDGVLNFRVTDVSQPIEPIVAPDSEFYTSLGMIFSGADRGFGSEGDDILGSFGGDDRLFGLGGQDRLVGLEGNDYLDGGQGNDVLIGGAGKDRLFGGEGTDIFGYREATDSGVRGPDRDQILDFSSTDGDKIDLRGIDGNLDTQLSVVSAFSHTAGELVIRADGGDHYSVLVDLDGNGRADFALGVTTADSHPLAATDLVL